MKTVYRQKYCEFIVYYQLYLPTTFSNVVTMQWQWFLMKLTIWNILTIVNKMKTRLSKNGKHLTSIIDDSAIIWDEVITSSDKETKTIPTN